MSFFDDFYGITLSLLCLLIFYICFQALIEHKKIHLVHETGFGILVWFLLGFILKISGYQITFSGQEFFQIMLPPIIFSGGYTLKNKSFFSNFGYISLFAVLGTLISFALILLLTIGFLNQGMITDLNNNTIDLTAKDILYFSATVCSSDTIAALALISSKTYPKLFSVVVGEGLLNDAVSLILFNSISKIVNFNGEAQLSSTTFWSLIFYFIKSLVISILIGLVVGLAATYITKVYRSLMQDPVKVNIFLLAIGYSSYCLGEIAGVSSVISMLASGIVMNHYMKHNMEEESLKTTTVTISTISSITESILFIYLGLSSWSYIGDKSKISYSFIILGFLITLIARFGCIYIASLIAIILTKKKWGLNKFELLIIWFSGLIRGAVAFALIINVENQLNPAVTSTILFIVFFTTIILGGFMQSFKKKTTQTMDSSLKVKENNLLLQGIEIEKRKLKTVYNASIFRLLEDGFLKSKFIFDYPNKQKLFKEEKNRSLQQKIEEYDQLKQQIEQYKQQKEITNSSSQNKLDQSQQNGINNLMLTQVNECKQNYILELTDNNKIPTNFQNKEEMDKYQTENWL
ncbi:hypothetical protein ABPG72_011649 [Tetrahymena utriculariae]